MASQTQSSKPRWLIIDGDQYCYRVSAALERQVDWGDGVHTLHSDDREAIEVLEKSIHDLKDSLDAAGIEIALSSEKNFRKRLAAYYKENRRDTRKPLVYHALREFLTTNYTVRQADWLEADDIMGIMATNPNSKKDWVMVSSDKDMLQVPAKLWRPEAGVLVETDEATGHRYHMYQTLVGDRVDNYPGCPGIGEAKAGKLLADNAPEDYWASVLVAYEKAGLTKEDALLQARLARILQFNDYDVKKRKVKLWEAK